MNITDLKNSWRDEPDYHKQIHESFIENVNADEELKKHRDFVEQNAFGFGERSFWWLWKLLCKELPEDASMLEIGVFRGATLSVWKLLKPKGRIFGVTPMDSSDGHWESDYKADIARMHDEFNLPQPRIFHGRSDNPKLMSAVTTFLYDCVYIDGDHSYEGALHDLVTYAPLVRKGSYLIIDDACCDMKMPWGFFQGIETVTNATLDYMKDNSANWDFVTNVVHLRVYRRK